MAKVEKNKEQEVKQEKSKVVVFRKNPTGYTNLAYSLGDRLTLSKDILMSEEMKNDLIAKGYIEEL
jgi:hypothetical protein